MSEQDRDKWDQKYAENRYQKNNPVRLLDDWIAGRTCRGKALDVACGAGRNAISLARAGFDVDAIDISAEGLAQAELKALELGLQINWIEHDLDRSFEFDTDYDVVVMMWFVNLDLLTRLCDCLVPGGYLLCEEHLISTDSVIGPVSERYRVAPGALRAAVSSLDIELYRESVELNDAGEQVASARVVARRPVGESR